MYRFLPGILMWICIAPVFFLLAIYSLKYHALKFNTTPEQLQQFLDQLHYALNDLFGESAHQPSPEGMSQAALMQNMQQMRLFCSIFPFAVIGATMVAVLQQQHLLAIMGNGVAVMLLFGSWLVCWRFGQRLGDFAGDS